MQSESCTNNPGNAEEASRLAVLQRYDILDTPRESAFDDISRLAAHICQAPIALISLVDKDRQWFKSEVGAGVRETPLETSVCAYAIRQRDLFVVPDLRADERFKNYALVTGPPHVRFYAGAVLESPDGHALGTLCVLDYMPRILSAQQAEALRTLARQVMNQLELRNLVDAQRAAIEVQRKLDEDLRTALQEAEAANKAKDRFLAVLSHELRTPLAPALMTATMLAGDASLPASARDDARLIQRNIELETRLIDDLLDVSRVINGKLQLHVEHADLNTLIQHSMAMCAVDSEARGVPIQLDLKATRHAVDGDSAKLQQLFCNLLKNAIKFTPSGGTVTVHSEDTTAGRIRVSVKDSGIGIAPEVLPRLFRPFEQGGSATTDEYGGLGLGLMIAKGIIDAHHGSIAALSDGQGHGSTLVVELPVTASQAPAPPKPAQPGRSASTSLTILLVEDHHDTLRAMSRLLLSLKHRVIPADCVGAALKASREHDVDLVISDVGLPDGTGLDLMRQLLAERSVPGIALTGYGMEADIEETVRAGFAKHLTKPINFSDLEEAIRELSL